MASHSSILPQKILWTEKPGGLQSIRLQESDTTQQLNHQSFLAFHLLLRVPTQLTLLTKLLSFCFYFLTASASTFPLNACAMLLLAITTETLSNWPKICPDIKLLMDICMSVLYGHLKPQISKTDPLLLSKFVSSPVFYLNLSDQHHQYPSTSESQLSPLIPIFNLTPNIH